MLLIFISWLYILAVSLVIGCSINRVIGLKNNNTVVTLLLGFFGVTLFTGFWAIGFAVDGYFHGVLALIVISLFIVNYSLIKDYVLSVKAEFKQLSFFFKGFFLMLLLLILAQCASAPFIIDNESYYLQTITWLNEYGFVKGLVNLHLFLGQTSGWHILQSAFSFHFVYDRFNDLSGLMLLLGNYYAITQLNHATSVTRPARLVMVFGLFPVFNVLFFQFISAPSPDLAIYVLALISCQLFITHFADGSKEGFVTVTLLCLFMVLIKLTALPFCVLPLILFVKHYKTIKPAAVLVFGATILTTVLLLTKNVILTGNALFPLAGWEVFKTSWQLPTAVETYFSQYGKAYGYHLAPEVFESSSWILRFKSWFFAPALHGIFNKGIVILLLIMPLLIKRFYNTTALWVLYGLALLQLLVLFCTSPQYRFFLPFVLLFGLLLLATLLVSKKTVYAVLVFSTVVTVIPLCFSITNQPLANNVYHEVSSTFKPSYLLQPHKNSRFSDAYKTITIENTPLHLPTAIDFFWGTGDVPVPALNAQQLEYFKTHFKVVPQQFTTDLKDGFYSKVLQEP